MIIGCPSLMVTIQHGSRKVWNFVADVADAKKYIGYAVRSLCVGVTRDLLPMLPIKKIFLEK